MINSLGKLPSESSSRPSIITAWEGEKKYLFPFYEKRISAVCFSGIVKKWARVYPYKSDKIARSLLFANFLFTIKLYVTNP